MCPSLHAEVSWCNTASVCQQTGLARSPVKRGNTRGEIPTLNTIFYQITIHLSINGKWQCLHLLQALALDEIKSHHWCIISCSAVTGENLLTGVDWLLDDIAARIFTTDWMCPRAQPLIWWALIWSQAHHWTMEIWRIKMQLNVCFCSISCCNMQTSMLSASMIRRLAPGCFVLLLTKSWFTYNRLTVWEFVKIGRFDRNPLVVTSHVYTLWYIRLSADDLCLTCSLINVKAYWIEMSHYWNPQVHNAHPPTHSIHN